MQIIERITLAIGLLLAVTTGLAETLPATVQTVLAAGKLAPAGISAARVAAMRLSGATRALMVAQLVKGVEPKNLVYPADGIVEWAKVLPTMFPPGTGPDAIQTKAKAEIWTDRPGFSKHAADYLAAAEKLRGFAHANDAKDFRAQLATVGNACNACHRAYRSGPVMNFAK